MTENRFYNYDDALEGVVQHLAMAYKGKTRNLGFLITGGDKTVSGYNPKLHGAAANFLVNAGTREGYKRQIMAQEAFGMHFYFTEDLARLHATVVIDELVLGTAAGTFAVIRDVVATTAQAKGLSVGTVFIFAVEASI